MKLRTLIMVLIFGVSAGLYAEQMSDRHEGHGGGPGMHARMGGGPEGMLKQLDLSKDQKAKLKALRRARRDKNQALHDKLQDAREELKELLQVADRSKGHEDKLRAQNEAVLKLMADEGRERFDSILEIRGILTDAQLKKFVAHGGPEGKEGDEGHEKP